MTILYCVTIQNKGCQFLKNPLSGKIKNIYDFFSVSLLDTLQHDYLEPEYELSPSIKKLLRFLCKMNENETLKVQRINVATQKDNGKYLKKKYSKVVTIKQQNLNIFICV